MQRIHEFNGKYLVIKGILRLFALLRVTRRLFTAFRVTNRLFVALRVTGGFLSEPLLM